MDIVQVASVVRFDHTLNEQQSAALARVDALAAQALGWVAPLRLGVAQSEAECDAVYRMRYETVTDRGWLQPADLPDGRERDAYDDLAVHLVLWNGEVLAASARLIFPAPGLKLPTEEAFDLQIEPRGLVVDAGRFVVARAYADHEQRLFAALLAHAWLEVRARGFAHVCAAFASPAMLRMYKRIGFQITTLGPARFYWGRERYPILFDTAESAPALIERWLPEDERS